MAKNKIRKEDAQRRDIPFKLTKFSLNDDGTIEGYGSVFGNIDMYGTVVDKGAFTKTLQENTPKMLWQHDWQQPIGVWDNAVEDDYGLKLSGHLILGVQQADEARALLQAGALDGLSIGFYPVRVEYDDDDVTHFTEVGLMEVSVVTFPANTEATVTSVKSLRDMFHDLDEEQRRKVATLIHSFKQSPSDTTPAAPEVATPENDHLVVKNADKEQINAPDPQDVVLHSLEAIDKALERLMTTRK